MIKEIHIHNFQSHKHSELELDAGVNVIVGASDSGKSAIIRALRWLIWNRPVGDSFISNWADGSFVNVVTDEQDVIQRLKSPKGNQYRINDKTFKAIGNDVPQPVQEILNMDETNLQQQLDSPFLLASTPGEVASYFNKVAHLTQIDDAVRRIQSQYRSISSQITADEVQIQSFESDLKRYQFIDKFEARLEILEEEEKKLVQLQTALRNLTTIINQLKGLWEEMEQDKEFLQLEQKVEDLLDLYNAKQQITIHLDDLKYAVGMLQSFAIAEQKYKGLKKLAASIDNLLGLYESQNALQGEVDRLSLHIRYYDEIRASILETKESMKTMEEEFHKHMPEKCPLCGK